MARLREGRANARGGPLPAGTVSRVRTAPAGSPRPAALHPRRCPKMDVRITIRQSASLRRSVVRSESGDAWTPIPLDGRRRRCGGDHLHPLPD